MKALVAEGYTVPTPIQAQAIPTVLTGRDLLGIAQTGTGKTAAFALPILHRLMANPKPAPRQGTRVLVLSPTRELATQIADSFRTYGRYTDLKTTTMFGGVGHRPQINAVRSGVDILVATPGRLLDHIDERNVVLSGTEILVLDEADQMLDMGFIRPIRRILTHLSRKRQNLFFSATMPAEIGTLAAEMLQDPVRVAVTPVAKTADRVIQKVIHIEAQKKRSLLVELFADPTMTRALVFTRTKRGADKVAQHLEQAGIKVSAIHGNKSQGQREAALAAFKAGRIRGLVATDIAARGIDVDMVSHVINFELPNIPEGYVHRIGRTARAGAEGIAISLCAGDERAYLRDIERLTRQTIPSEDRRGDLKLIADVRGTSTSADTPRRDSGHRRDSGRGSGRDSGRDSGQRRESGQRSDSSRDAGREATPGSGRDSGWRPPLAGDRRRGEGVPRSGTSGRPDSGGRGQAPRSRDGEPGRRAERVR